MSFPSGKFYLNFKTAIITGVCRSGKTTLGNLLATYKNVEHAEEPWTLNLLPTMIKMGVIKRKIGAEMFNAYLHELMVHTVLLRQANFRPGDLSAIWTKKPEKEILSRLINLKTRADVLNFVKKNKSVFLLIMPESLLFNLPAIFDAVPDAKIIHVVRKGTDVAHLLSGKEWLSDKQLTRPPHARIYYETIRRSYPFYLPCWIKLKDAERFIASSEYERGLLYWCSLMENMIESLKKSDNKKRCMTVKFEDLVANPGKTTEKAAAFLNVKPSSMTGPILREVKNYKNIRAEVPVLPEELIARVKKIYKHFGYEWS